MKKIISLDIDGTLYDSNKKVLPKTRDVLIKAQQAGHIICLNSGRPTAGLVPVADQLEMSKYHGMFLSYNGAIVTDSTTGKIIYSNLIPNELAKKLLKHIENLPVNPIVDDTVTIYTTDPESYQVPYESQSNNLKIKKVNNLLDSIDFNPPKILITAPPEILQNEVEKISEPFKSELDFVRSTPFYFEATMPNVSKANALRKACEVLNISIEDIIAFGDEQNDIPMFKLAGYSVAMGNAIDEIKSLANEVTKSNDEDGIAVALERLLNLK